MRNKSNPTTEPFVVVVTFPSSSKEYHYLCADPLVRQGSTVVANGTRVRVVRTTAYSSLASKYVQSDHEHTARERRAEILHRLAAIESVELQLIRYTKLKSPEAKKLVAELKRLN